MITISTSTSASGLIDYFDKGLDISDYYLSDTERVGVWHGKAAETLGLTGSVDRASFVSLANKENPRNDIPLFQRKSPKARVANDFTISAPKSVSILYHLNKDDRVMKAFEDSVEDTMKEIESHVETRVRKGGVDEDRHTGNMVYSTFIHTTSRDVNGVPDPQLHAHNTVFNLTYDNTEDRWKALQMRKAFKYQGYYTAYFRTQLANRLQSLGYDVRRTRNGFEVEGIDRETIETFSRRTEQIEKLAEEYDVKDPKKKAKLGRQSREAKTNRYNSNELRQVWTETLGDKRAARLRSITTEAQQRQPRQDAEYQKNTLRESFNYALGNFLERYSVADEFKLKTLALQKGIGGVTLDSLNAHIANLSQAGQIITASLSGAAIVTTAKAIQDERDVVQFVKSGNQSELSYFAPNQTIESTQLTDHQKQAVDHVWKSNDKVVGIKGGAGTGKTTLMKEVVRGIEATDKRVLALAPTSQATKDLDENFNALTVQRFIVDPASQDLIKDGVMWIDEAGLVGTQQMKKLFDIADTQNARIILTGDSSQHSSVKRGDTFRLLQEEGLSTVELSEIHRQKNSDYKRVVSHLSKGSEEATIKGFEKLDEMQAIHVIENDADRYIELAKNYSEAIDQKKKVLVVAPTRREGSRVTSAIREDLRSTGKIGKTDRGVVQHQSKRFTDADKEDIFSYDDGDIIQFNQNVEGIKRGEKLVVVSDKGIPKLQRDDTTLVDIPLTYADRFDVYASDTLPLATGDAVRITRNSFIPQEGSKPFRVDNQNTYTIKSFTKNGDIKLTNGKVIPKDFGHLEHGYTTTSVSSQGKTVDKVLIAQDSRSGLAANRNQFYVSVSRGRDDVQVYTDDKQQLQKDVIRSNTREHAVSGFASKFNESLQSLQEKIQSLEKSPHQEQKNNQYEISI